MTNQNSQQPTGGAAPCPPLADALAFHLDGRPVWPSGPWALGWDHQGLEAAGRLPAAAPATLRGAPHGV